MQCSHSLPKSFPKESFPVRFVQFCNQAPYSMNMSSPPVTCPKVDKSKITHVSEQILANGDFLNIARYIYKDHTGAERTWEVAGRTTPQKSGNSDCVGTLAVLRRMLKYDCLVLVKQYRPPLKRYTLELPAGLVDSSESPEETAIRELKEETGYTCTTVKHTSPLTALDPGLSKCTMKVVTVEINGDDIENHAPKQCDRDSEFIEVVQIPIHELLSRLNEYSDQGVMVDSRVYCFAIGLTIGAKNASYSQTANQY